MFAKDIFNGVPMMVLCVLAMVVVVIQPILFLRMSWKRGKELGIQTTNMKSCVRSSMLFSIVPTLPVLINYLVLLPAFGKYFAWLRLSVMGNAAYGPYLLGKLTNRCPAVGVNPQPVGN